MNIDLHSNSDFLCESTRSIAVIIKLEPITARDLDTTQEHGLHIENVDNPNDIDFRELNGGTSLHGIIQSRVFIVHNVLPTQRLKVVFEKTGQEVEFAVPFFEEFCEVTLKDSTYPLNK